MARQILFVGVGSPHGDDQAGWLVAERLAVTCDQATVAVRKARSPVQLIDWLDGVDRLIVCDACRGLGRAGALRRWTWPAIELPEAAWSGTHDLTLYAVLELAQRLGRLPAEVIVYGIEGLVSEPTVGLSTSVATALPMLVDTIARELNEMKLGPAFPCHRLPQSKSS